MLSKPITCVWEITMECNMNCGHCGSSCSNSLPDELTTKEALNFIDMCADMGLKWISISGGEPLIRKDIFKIISYAKNKGIITNIITNGFVIDEKIAKKLKNSGVSTVAISIDGIGDLHDKVRKPGSFNKAKNALIILKKYEIYTAAITTITTLNINELEKIKEFLTSINVSLWQLQIGLPMGNFLKVPNWLIKPNKIKYIMDFYYKYKNEGKIKIDLADCIGYYGKKDVESKEDLFEGCTAGIKTFGILCNGDIVACTSIRDKNFKEGNIREKSLKQIWEDKNSFLWRRTLTKEKLLGNCKNCEYGKNCLGGCTNTRLLINKSIYSSNEYCCHSLEKLKVKF